MQESSKEDAILKKSIWFLVGTAFLSGVGIEMGGLTINVSHVAGLMLFVFLTIYQAINRKSFIVLYKDAPSLFLYLYLLSNVISSILFSPNKALSLKGCILIFSYVLIYIVLRWALKHVIDKPSLLAKFLRYNYLSALFGLCCMAFSLYRGGHENIGVSLDQLGTARIPALETPLPSIKSLSVEPNLFAIITASILTINLATYLLWRKSRAQLASVSIISLAVLFAYTRSVYVSLVFALLCILFLANRIKIVLSIFNYFIIVLVLFSALLIFLPDDNNIKNALVSRGSTLLDFKQGSGEGRVMGFKIAWEGFIENPVLGNGTLSANTTFYNPYRKIHQERMGSPGWLNGILIQAMQDTGVIGMTILISLFVSIILANYRIFRKLKNDQLEKSILLGFIGGNMIMFIASQTSSSLWISFPYIYWAINMSYLGWCKDQLEIKH